MSPSKGKLLLTISKRWELQNSSNKGEVEESRAVEFDSSEELRRRLKLLQKEKTRVSLGLHLSKIKIMTKRTSLFSFLGEDKQARLAKHFLAGRHHYPRVIKSRSCFSGSIHRAPPYRAFIGSDDVARESIVKSSGRVPTTPTAPTSKNVAGKVPASKPPIINVVVLLVLS